MEKRHWTIGADLSCDVVIKDDHVSPRHCVVIQESGHWYVQPIDGQLKVADKTVTGRTAINSATSVWLSPQTRLPWPSDVGSVVLTVGRAVDCDITLESPGVSGRHAKLLIGPQGTIVLEDWQSKNGLRLDAESVTAVKAVDLQSVSKVFFGASPFSSAALIERANVIASPTPARLPSLSIPLEPGRSAREDRSPRPKHRKKHDSNPLFFLKYSLSFCAPTILLGSMYALGWLPFLTRKQPTEVIANVPMDISVETRHEEKNMAPKAKTSSLPIAASESLAAPTPILEPTVSTVAPSHCVYWVVVKHRETGNWFRLGSAVAIGDKTLLTVGSIAQAAFQMSDGDYEMPSVVHVLSRKIMPIESQQVHPQLAKRMAVADKANADRQKRLTENPADKLAIEKATKLLNVSMSAAAAVDCATLQVAAMEQFLVIDAKTKLRPKQSFRVFSSPFPVNEPHWDEKVPSTATNVEVKVNESIGKIDTFGLTLDGVPGQTIAAIDASEAGLNWFGSPCVNDANQLIGIVLYAETKQTQTGSVELELLSPSAAEKMLSQPEI